jgi:hypothetical protein
MQTVPLQAVASQNQQIVLNGQNCEISVYVKTGYAYSDQPAFTTPNTNLYFDLSVNGTPVTTFAIGLNAVRLLKNRQYLDFEGDFMFVDTQGTSDPQVSGLGTRYLLLYLLPSDIGPNA